MRNERDPDDKTRAAGRNEFEQARRLNNDLKEIREGIRACWDRSDDGRSFSNALDAQGLILARGDRRDFVVVDREGGDHALGKRITGATAAETRARLADLDRSALPSVAEAKEMQQDRAHGVTPARDLEKHDDQLASAAIEKMKSDERAQREALASLGAAARADETTLRAAENRAFWAEYRDKRDAATTARVADWEARAAADTGWTRAAPPDKAQTKFVDGGLRVATTAGAAVADTLANVAEGLLDLFSGSSTPEPITPADYIANAEARRAWHAQQEAARAAAIARGEALDRLRQDILAKRPLDPSAVHKLSREDLEGIKANGDSHLLRLIDIREREEKQRREDYGRERDR